MTALMALPGVPAIYHCHGAVWRNCAPQHPRIHRYVAMSTTLAQRMETESNIPASRITVLLNGVDLTRFATVRKPPERPARVLFYNGYHAPDSPTASAAREAASRCGLAFDFIGRQAGRMIAAPEQVLPEYDIVLASGISAAEALACGCALVVLGRTSAGPMVTTANFDHFRQVNFSIPVNSPPPSADSIAAEFRRFSARDAVFVSESLRQVADFRLSVGVLVDLYKEVIAENTSSNPQPVDEILAASRYLRKIVPVVKIMDDIWNFSQLSAAADSIDQLGAKFTRFEEQLGARFPGPAHPGQPSREPG
jgi:hypothetical protein